MTEVRNAYASWSRVYDTNVNHTRDSEALVLKTMVPRTFPDDTRPRVLELGCGTGKNTTWLSAISESVVSVDFSEEMMAMAKQKVAASGRTNVTFHIADLTVPDDWSSFNGHTYDLVVFSLVLEHIRELEPVIRRAAECLAPGGLLYIGEIHPARQYSGSQARFAVDGDKVEKSCDLGFGGVVEVG
ncbi:S-adenosyl-L-methionine-dependent methyltransferase [Hyaloraphidium curvatum]|nr:S-adenosyl-L-methionine-dependent methyltransferase [Hyaloraphidium curvatum]